MATAFLINSVLSAGIERFVVFTRAPGVIVWNNYTNGTRVPVGYEVRFTPVVYEGMTLKTHGAYYISAYGENVDLTLTQVDAGSWSFTMPSSDAYLTATVETSSAPEVLPQTWTDMVPPKYVEAIISPNNVISGIEGFSDGYEFTSQCRNAFLEFISSLNLAYYVMIRRNSSAGSYFPQIWIYVHTAGSIVTSNTTIKSQCTLYLMNCSISSAIGSDSDPYILDGTQFVQQSTYTNSREWGTGCKSSGRASTSGGYVYDFCPVIFGDSPSPTPSSPDNIRYVLSPENSGIVTGPDTYSGTSFNFTFKIKLDYDLFRFTAFGCTDPTGTPPVPREEALVTSEQYDGNTRTYTFGVSGIQSWATSVRCIIQTTFLGDTQVQGGTNASSGPVGGNGSFDDTSDPVPLPGIPSGMSAADSGLITLFRPYTNEIKRFGDYLWSNIDDFWENLQKIFTNPMDYIIGLNIFPVDPPTTTARPIYIGNWLTDIIMEPVEHQFYEFDCGGVNIKEYYGAYLDYEPNTKAHIMLPFIGDREINVNEIMGKYVHLWYRIDLLSGACLAVLTVNNDVKYQWTGNCAIPIPLTGSDWSRLYSGIAKAGATLAGAAIGGLAGAAAGLGAGSMGSGPLVTSNAATMVGGSTTKTMDGNGITGSKVSLAKEPIEPESSGTVRATKSIPASSVIGTIGHNIMGVQPRVQHSGDVSGAISIMGLRTAYIALDYPNVNLPEDYKHVMGYPSNQFMTLGDLKGYTECRTVLFSSTTATDDETEMVIKALKGGVYL